MPNTTVHRFGDLVPFPFTDQTGIKKRPAIIVSSDAHQLQRPDVVLMAVTRPAGAVGEVVISEWQRAGLPRASLIKPVLATIEKRLILRKLGELQQQDRTALRQAGDVRVFHPVTPVPGCLGSRALPPALQAPGGLRWRSDPRHAQK
jgi:mRNA interferase MazF